MNPAIKKTGERISVPTNRFQRQARERLTYSGFLRKKQDVNPLSSKTVLISAFLFCFGCALQSSVVDLEQDVKTTREAQQEILVLREKMEKMIHAVENIPTNDTEGKIALLGKINRLEQQVQRLEGLLEEESNKRLAIMQKTDNQAGQESQILARIDLLEKQISVLATTSLQATPTGNQPPSELQTPPVQRTEDTKPQEAPAPNGGTRPGISSGKTSGFGVSSQEAYRLAYNDYLSGKYDLAVISFKNYIATYPDSIFLPEALYWIGQSHYSQSQYTEAISFFQEMEKRYPTHDLVPNAILKTALSFAALGDTASARSSLTKVIERFPQSDAALRAKGELSALNSRP